MAFEWYIITAFSYHFFISLSTSFQCRYLSVSFLFYSLHLLNLLTLLSTSIGALCTLAFLIFSLLLLFSSLFFFSLNFFLYMYSPSSVFSLLFLILTFSSSLSSYCLFFAFLVLAKRVSDRVGGAKRRFSPMSRPRRAGGCESRSGFIYIIILMCE